jgi:hypothetical protein
MAAFLLVLAPMLRWYAYPRLAVVPADVDGTLVSVGDATVFDIDDRVERRTDLTSVRTVRSDVSTGTGEVAVWDTASWSSGSSSPSSLWRTPPSRFRVRS